MSEGEEEEEEDEVWVGWWGLGWEVGFLAFLGSYTYGDWEFMMKE